MLGLKVLDDQMRSCNGGIHSWSLGVKYEHEGRLVLGRCGFHLTYRPDMFRGTRVFLAEASEVKSGSILGTLNSFVCRSVTLLRELSAAELRAYNNAISSANKNYNETVQRILQDLKEVR